jgi:hypothetical protein
VDRVGWPKNQPKPADLNLKTVCAGWSGWTDRIVLMLSKETLSCYLLECNIIFFITMCLFM